MVDNFSVNHGAEVGADGLGVIQAHSIYCALESNATADLTEGTVHSLCHLESGGGGVCVEKEETGVPEQVRKMQRVTQQLDG